MISSSLPCSLFWAIFQYFLIEKFDKISIAEKFQIFDPDGALVIWPSLIEKNFEFFEIFKLVIHSFEFFCFDFTFFYIISLTLTRFQKDADWNNFERLPRKDFLRAACGLSKEGSIFQIIGVTLLPHMEFEPNDH